MIAWKVSIIPGWVARQMCKSSRQRQYIFILLFSGSPRRSKQAVAQQGKVRTTLTLSMLVLILRDTRYLLSVYLIQLLLVVYYLFI